MIAMVLALMLSHHATFPCEQIKEYVAAFGKQNVVNSARKHGYTDKQIAEIIRRCHIT